MSKLAQEYGIASAMVAIGDHDEDQSEVSALLTGEKERSAGFVIGIDMLCTSDEVAEAAYKLIETMGCPLGVIAGFRAKVAEIKKMH